jgi:hypothetical protein
LPVRAPQAEQANTITNNKSVEKTDVLNIEQFTCREQYFEKLMTNYFSKYDKPYPIHPSLCNKMKEIFPMIEFKENVNFKNNNKHPIMHEIRNVYENRNIVENTKLVYDSNEDKFLSISRRVIDINSTRLLKAGIDPIILMPHNESADADRIRNATTNINHFIIKANKLMGIEQIKGLKEVQKEYKKLSEDEKKKHTLDETLKKYKESEDYTDGNYYVDTPKENVEVFMQKKEKEINEINAKIDKDNADKKEQKEHEEFPTEYLINLTDIIYYLDAQQLYTMAKNLSEGTIAVGTAHIPKYLDMETHYISFGANIEGTVKIIPDEFVTDLRELDVDDCTMIMRANGNDHLYQHPLEYLKWLQPTGTYIIPPAEGQKENFILKTIALDSVDTGATHYVRFKIVKIEKPTAEDYTPDELFINPAYMNILNDVDDILDNKELSIYDKLTKCYDTWNGALINKPLIQNKYYKQKAIEDPFLKNIEKKMPKPDDNNVIRIDDTYAIGVPKKGFFVNKYKMYTMKTMHYIADLKSIIDASLISKIQVKILNMEKIEKTTVKSLVTFIQRELPELNVNTEILPLIATIIKDSLQSESSINALLSSNITEAVNYIKNNDGNMKRSLFSRILYCIQCCWETGDVYASDTLRPQNF